jgi:hypothetical protein
VTKPTPADLLLGKLDREAKIAPEQRNAFQAGLLAARKSYLSNVRRAANERPGNEAAALAEIAKSIRRFQQAVERSSEFCRMRKALTSASMAVRSIAALPPSGQNSETRLDEAMLLQLPELLSATAKCVDERRVEASTRVRRHRPLGEAARDKHLALVLWCVAKKYSPQLSDNEMKDWLGESMTWCGAKQPESWRFRKLADDLAARWLAAQ